MCTKFSDKPFCRLGWDGQFRFFSFLSEAKALVGGGRVIWYQGGTMYVKTGRNAWTTKEDGAGYIPLNEWHNLNSQPALQMVTK